MVRGAHNITRVGDAGVATVEGSLSGARSAQLAREREIQGEEFAAKEARIRQQNQSQVNSFGSKFSTAESAADEALRSSTVGLMSAQAYTEALDQSKAAVASATGGKNADKKKTGYKGSGKGKRKAPCLSFGLDDDDDDDTGGGGEATAKEAGAGAGVGVGKGAAAREARDASSPAAAAGGEPAAKKLALNKKDPTVATGFLPDRDRDAQVEGEKQRLRQQWLAEQEQAQAQRLEVTYSFWDGSGHRKTLTLHKGATIDVFLGLVQKQCADEFRDIRAAGADNLMYVKEDLVIPHHLSFYDLIVTRARGKSGPLFCFDVHDDVRALQPSLPPSLSIYLRCLLRSSSFSSLAH